MKHLLFIIRLFRANGCGPLVSFKRGLFAWLGFKQRVNP